MIAFIAADLEINVPINQLLNIKNWQFIDILFFRMANYCGIVENLNIYMDLEQQVLWKKRRWVKIG